MHGPLDTMNVRFLNFSQVPILSPLCKPLRIDMYDDQYFNSEQIKQKVEELIKYQSSNQVNLQAFKIHSKPNITPIK